MSVLNNFVTLNYISPSIKYNFFISFTKTVDKIQIMAYNYLNSREKGVAGMKTVRHSGVPIMKLKGLRAERGLTQTDVANAIGVTVATYCRKEAGEQDFYRREIEGIMKLFGRSYEELFGNPLDGR